MMNRHAVARHARSLPALAAVALLLLAAACARPRDIRQPVSGALAFTFPDSALRVIDAAIGAVTDEGVPLRFTDRKQMYVESDYVDIGSLRASTSREAYSSNERLVKFQFRAEPTFGATRLTGEVIYLPLGGQSRAMERMVPEQHAGREVLQRMFVRVNQRLQRERERDAERAKADSSA